MTVIIKLKSNNTTATVPASLQPAEFAYNIVDRRLFSANSTVVFDAIQNTAVDFSISNNSTGAFRVGNSTVNSVSNSSAFVLANSTVTFIITRPSAADYAAATKFLSANGSFLTPAGGSASPGGGNTDVQFNDSGAFLGNSGFTFNKTTNNVTIANTITIGNSTVNTVANSSKLTVTDAQFNGNIVANSDYISLGNSTINSVLNSISWSVMSLGTNNITAPVTGNTLSYFTKFKAGRMMPITIGSSGWDSPLQAHFMHNTVYQMVPLAGGTAASVIRLTSANTVAFTARTPASTNIFLSQVRLGHTTGATAGTTISWRNGTGLPFWRGNAAGLGGFYAVCRFGVASAAAQGRAFIGFKNSTTALSNGNPSAQTNIIGFGWDSAATNVFAMSANSTVANSIDTGLTCTTGNTDWYEGVIFAPPNGGTVQYQITNLSNGTIVTGSYNQTNLPSTTTFLTWQFWGNNGSTAGAHIMDWGGVQIEVNL